ncbi:MAG: hypothetical protein H6727_05265 [Myxococcales bacterium]|nr:hypothetical protein [Myxococcales bacterium]
MRYTKGTLQTFRSLCGWGALILFFAVLPASATPLKYTEDRPPSVLNPIFAEDMYSVRATELIFESLIGWDKDQKPAPMLATEWSVAPDKKSITMTLRKGVKWHDGKDFSSDDVEFTIRTMTSRKTQIADRYLAQIIKGVKPMGPLKVMIEFKKPLSRPERWLQFKIIPKHRFKEGVVRRSDYFNQKPYGTGPFRFRSWKLRKILLRRFSSHWRGSSVRLDGVTLQAIPDKNIQREVLRYGGLDTIIRVRPKDIPLFERDQGVGLMPYSTNDWWYLGLNHRNKSIFRDKRVREAFMLALDRGGLRDAHLGDGQIISGPFSPNDPLYNFSVEARSQDIEKASKLLDAAGWKKVAGKPIRMRGRKPLKVEFLLPRSKNSYKELCLAIQGEMRKVGVDIDLVWIDDVAWDRRVFTQKQFDMVLHIWNFDELSTIYPLFHSRGNRNYIGYKNKEVDRLLAQATRTTDPVIYKAIYGKLHKILHKELPYVFLWSLTNYSAMSSRVKKVTIHPFNYFHYAHSWIK